MSRLKKVLLTVIVFAALACVAVFSASCGKKGSNQDGYNKGDPVIETINVKFDSLGGTSVSPQTVKKGEKIKKPNIPTAEGKVFDYWAIQDGDKYYAYNFNAEPTEDITLFAVWKDEIVKYTVTFNMGNGESKSFEYQKGEGLALPQSPENESNAQWTYTFSGWLGYDKNGERISAVKDMPVNSDITFNPVFEEKLNEYYISFVADGKTVQTELLPYGSKINLPNKDLNKEDNYFYYNFLAWEDYSDDMTVTGNKSFTAKYELVERKYNVSFMVEGKEISTESYTYNATVKLPEEVKVSNGYTLDGWKTIDGEKAAEFKVNGDMTLQAVLKANDYKVMFDTNSSISLDDLKFTVESENITLPVPERQGYEFLGWFDGNEKVENIEKGTFKDISLVARWLDLRMTVISDLKDVNSVYGTNVELNYEVAFDGESEISYIWYFKPNGSDGFGGVNGGTSKVLSAVAESGTYYSVATVKTAQGEVVEYKSSEAVVTIEKAPQKINANDQAYDYDGNLHIIEGVTAMENAELIYYYGDGIYGLTDAGSINVNIIAKETANYLKAEKTVVLTVNQKEVKVTAGELVYNEKNQWGNITLTYTDINGKVCQAVTTEQFNIVDSGEYEVTAHIEDKNYIPEGKATVKVLMSEYVGLIPDIGVLNGVYGNTLADIPLTSGNFAWKNSELKVISDGDFEAVFTSDNPNYYPANTTVSVKLQRVTYKFALGTGESGYRNISSDVLDSKEVTPYLNGPVTLPAFNESGEEIVWFDRADGIGRFYRGNESVVTAGDKTLYGVWYYQTTEADYEMKDGKMKYYNTTGHKRIITPTDINEFYVGTDGYGAFANGMTTPDKEITHMIITKNITDSPKSMEYFTFKMTALKNVIIEGDFAIDNRSFRRYKPMFLVSDNIDNMTLLTNGVTYSGDKFNCNIYTSYVDTYQGWTSKEVIGI